MSATRGGKDPTDLFVTPAWTVDAVLPHLPAGRTVLDAGCGTGAILNRLIRWRTSNRVLGVELDSARAELARARYAGLAEIITGDWLDTTDVVVLEAVDVIVTNPPFSLAEQWLERCLDVVRPVNGTVACLLRASWHIPACRADFVKRHPFDLGWLTRRPSFVASLKCRSKCGWETMQALDVDSPKVCPGCGKGKVSRTTNDSADYGWYLFGPGRGGRMFALELPAAEVA